MRLNNIVFLSTLSLSFFFTGSSLGQTTRNPYVSQSNYSNCKIMEVKIENNKTSILLEYEKTKSDLVQSWVSFSSFTYLTDFNNTTSLRIIGLGQNQLDTRYSTTGKKGQKYYFTLVFPKLPPGIEKINIKEVTLEGGGFEWRGISITNPDYSPKSSWTELSLKSFWQTTNPDILEGIYENAIELPNSPKYKLALKKSDLGYDLIYLSGGEDYQTSKFKEGDIKAFLTKTAKDNLLKAKWIMGDKSINENLYITFDDALMKIIWTDGNPEQLYIKLFPISSTSNNSNGIATSGTGFALSSNGFIVTNHHVIDGARNLSVKGVNGDFSISYKAKIVVSDKNNDLAIIQIDDNDFSSIAKIPYSIKPNNSDVGENVFVLGYPLRATMGDEIKLTNGIVSSKTGFQGDITSYQISAPVQPGNSGGPLFDQAGNLIGVINAKHIGAENVSYAIKVSYLKNLIDLLPSSLTINTTSNLAGLSLSDQVRQLNKFVYIIETK